MAAIAVLGVVLSTAAVNHHPRSCSRRLRPTRTSTRDLTDMSAAVEAWSSTGVVAAKDDYEQALVRLPADQQRVRQFAAGDNELELLVLRQERAARDWITGYASPRMQAKGGTLATPQQVRSGSQLFNSVRSAHQATTAAFDSRVRQASTDASFRLKGTILAVVLLAIVAWWLVSWSRRRLTAELTQPLLDLEAVVQRMALGDHEVRAQQTGPKEVRRSRPPSTSSPTDRRAPGRSRAGSRPAADAGHRAGRLRPTCPTSCCTPLTTIAGYLEMVARSSTASPAAPREDARGHPAQRHAPQAADRRPPGALARRGPRLGHGAGGPGPAGARGGHRRADHGGAPGIHLHVDTPRPPSRCWPTAAMLHRAFCNVLTNAVKFSDQNGSVEVALHDRDGRRGLGRRPRHRHPGRRDRPAGHPLLPRPTPSKRDRRHRAAGCIMQTIIDRHDGDVVIDSTEGEGGPPCPSASPPAARRGTCPAAPRAVDAEEVLGTDPGRPAARGRGDRPDAAADRPAFPRAAAEWTFRGEQHRLPRRWET